MESMKKYKITSRMMDLADKELESDMNDKEASVVGWILMTAVEEDLNYTEFRRAIIEADEQFYNFKVKGKV